MVEYFPILDLTVVVGFLHSDVHGVFCDSLLSKSHIQIARVKKQRKTCDDAKQVSKPKQLAERWLCRSLAKSLVVVSAEGDCHMTIQTRLFGA